MKKNSLIAYLPLLAAFSVHAGPISVGAAPQGDVATVASRIIKYNFPACRRVTNATRLSDRSIRASCDGTDYRVFTVYSAQEGKMIEVALNCAAAKTLLNINCF
jgi:hypothetical protein